MVSKYTTLLVREESSLYDDLEPKVCNSPSDIAKLLNNVGLGSFPEERLYVLALNAKNTVLGISEVGKGSLSRIVTSAREVFRTAILLNAAGVVIAHNHPSGDPTPSPEDIAMTNSLKVAGEVIGIPVLDHIIIGEDFFSFANGGLLN